MPSTSPRCTTATPTTRSPPSTPRATIRYADGRIVELNHPFEGGGLNYETAHFCDLLRAGALESPIMTHAKSLQMIAMMDAARATLGLKFAGE